MQTESLLFPVNIEKPDTRAAQRLIALYRASNGEMASALCYIARRFAGGTAGAGALLHSIGREEQRHLEMMSAIIAQLSGGARFSLMNDANFGRYFTETGWRAHRTPYAAPAVSCRTVAGGLKAELALYLSYEHNARDMFDKMADAMDDDAAAAPMRFLKKREEAHICLLLSELGALS